MANLRKVIYEKRHPMGLRPPVTSMLTTSLLLIRSCESCVCLQMCVCVCVRESVRSGVCERERMFVCVCTLLLPIRSCGVCERDREYVCVREIESMCVPQRCLSGDVCLVCMCGCVCVWERERVCVYLMAAYQMMWCVFVWEKVVCVCMGESGVCLYGRKWCVLVWEKVVCVCMGESGVCLYGRKWCVFVWEKVVCLCWVSTLQHTATHCNTLQHTATHCNTLQHTYQMIRCVCV